MKKFNYLALASIAALAMGSCSNESDLEQGVNDGSIRVSASINQVKTRATDSDWSVGDKIGVTDDKGNNNVAYEASSSNGNFTSVGEGITIKGNDTYTFKAYYPYTEDGGVIAFNVVDENYNIADQTKVDFLYASGAQANRNNPNVNFSFYHKMAKLALTFTNDDESLEADAKISYTISNVATEGTFDPATGAVTAGEANSYIKANPSLDAVSAAIVPSFATANTGELSIVVVVENGEETVNYSGTIKPELLAGNQYSYTLDIAYGKGLTITGGTINGWQQNTGNGTLQEGGETPELPHTTVVGDYLLKDGSILDYTKTEEVEANKTDIVGVIAYTAGVVDGYTNGFAIALNNAGSDRMGVNNDNISTWASNNEGLVSGYDLSELSANSPSETSYLGYNNTQLLKLANANPTTADKPAFANLVDLLSQTESVSNASDWYLPNYGEFKLIENNRDKINDSLEAVDGVKLEAFEGSALTDGGFYWTSTLRGDRYAYINIMGGTLPDGATNYPQRTSGGTKGYFRFAIAF